MTLSGDLAVSQAGASPLRLRLDMNALCAFEAQTGNPALVWISNYEAGRVLSSVETRAMVWAMLQRHHPDLTLEQAGDLLDAHPDLVSRVISAALPGAGEGGHSSGKKPAAPSIWRRFFVRGSQPA